MKNIGKYEDDERKCMKVWFSSTYYPDEGARLSKFQSD